jgi:hypothetical protein
MSESTKSFAKTKRWSVKPEDVGFRVAIIFAQCKHELTPQPLRQLPHYIHVVTTLERLHSEN